MQRNVDQLVSSSTGASNKIASPNDIVNSNRYRARPRALDGAFLASFGFLRSGRAKMPASQNVFGTQMIPLSR